MSQLDAENFLAMLTGDSALASEVAAAQIAVLVQVAGNHGLAFSAKELAAAAAAANYSNFAVLPDAVLDFAAGGDGISTNKPKMNLSML